jgi:hypothetical protein
MFCLGLAVAFVLIEPAPAVAACSESVLFQTATARPVGTKVNRLALADLNGDGILDLVGPMPESLTGVYANTIAVMLGGGSGGVGNGTFGTPSTWTVGTPRGRRHLRSERGRQARHRGRELGEQFGLHAVR